MISLSLDTIARVVRGTLRLAGDDGADTLISGMVDTDSRLISPGGVFVAKPGEFSDGHLYVHNALAAGAGLAIVERWVDVPITQIRVASVIDALAELARYVVAEVRMRGTLRIVAVTGSNGKTTTKNLIAAILAPEGETVYPVASFNNEVGAPLTMLRTRESTAYLVCEIGASAPGEIARLTSLIEPDVAVVLMVGMAHAGGFGGVESTAREKAQLISHARRTGVAVLNTDDARVRAMTEIANERDMQTVSFGRSDSPDMRAIDVDVHAQGTRFTLVFDGNHYPVHLKVLGEHHVMNALAALSVSTALGVPLTVAISRLETVDLAERWRMQVMGSDRVRIINDAYNASPDSMAAALKTLAQITQPHERSIAVLGAMTELGDEEGEAHDRIGLLAVRLRMDKIVIVGRDARRMYLSAIAEGSWSGEAVFCTDAEEAFEYLRGELRSGDRVLVKSSNSAGLRHLGDRLGEEYA